MSGFVCPAPFPGLAPGGWARSLALALTVAFPLLVAGSVWLFKALRHSSVFLRKRHFNLVVASALGSMVAWAVSALYDTVGPSKYPCALYFVLNMALAPIINFPPLVALTRYRNEVAQYAIAQKKFNRGSVIAETIIKDEEYSKTITWWQALRGHVLVTFGSRDPIALLQHAKFARSGLFFAFYGSINLAPYIIYFCIKLASDPRYSNNCYGCELDNTDTIALLVFNAYTSGMGTVLNSGRVRRHDALRIVRECRQIWMMTGIVLSLAYILFLIDPGNAYSNGVFNFRLFILLAAFINVYLHTTHQVLMARRLRRELLASSHINLVDALQDVLNNKDLKNDLRKHLLSELSAEILPFLESVEGYRQTYAAGSDDTILQAKRILETFINRAAPLEVNLSHITRNGIMTRVADNDYAEDLFDKAYEEMKNNFLNDGFARFLRNQKSRSTQVSNSNSTATGITARHDPEAGVAA